MKLTFFNVFRLVGVGLVVSLALPLAAQVAEDPAETVVGEEKAEDKKPGLWKRVFRGEDDPETEAGGSYARGIPASLQRVQDVLREGPLQNDPKARFYMDLVERDQASPAQLATF
ncbi:MAG: hypothetical protein R3344_11840, partial [Acidobacteriota bacterium]|nr:hypothetical protein [Acidobacteriota bacterium]